MHPFWIYLKIQSSTSAPLENNRSKTTKDWETINLQCNTTIPIQLNLDYIFNKIKGKMTSDDLLIVTGSFFLLSDLNLISKSET